MQHYDDKVDVWSIGALLYKVIVGQCGFYAVSWLVTHVHMYTCAGPRVNFVLIFNGLQNVINLHIL